MKIIDYKIVCENVIEIDSVVNNWIGKGWQPLGRAQVTKPFDETGGYSIWQTMVKFEIPLKRKAKKK